MTLDVPLLVRTLHVVAATIAVGAPLALALVTPRATDGGWEAGARRVEWAWWGALGVLLATGVGNLGAYGEALPAADSAWGVVLLAKLATVLLLVGVGLARTLRLTLHAGGASHPRGMYGATGALGMVALALALLLAHG